MQLSPKKRRRAFFQCWSRKEACLKALGVGLQLPFTTFSVPFTANVTSEIVHIPNVPITEYINLSSIHMEGNFSAAVAVLGAASVRINMLHFKEEFFSSI
jgi:4'-phosphopantetheinyl transferase